jgi:putative DNA methylase
VTDDKRLIEDYLPIEKISAEASREKSPRRGHISTLHLWWARRPLVACRAAVYGALVPASRFVPNGASDEKKKSLGRANAAKFVERLCHYPGSPSAVAEAEQHILEAHAARLTQETGKKVTPEDIVEGHAPRPKILDMFAGGGAIPLEALRLGCEAYALELNPVAHIIELCTLVYPQKYGKPNPAARGKTGPKSANGETTWAGLAEEVEYWGNWMIERTRSEIGDLYAPIPDPDQAILPQENVASLVAEQQNLAGFSAESQGQQDQRLARLTAVAYLWTRTVRCKNPACDSVVPLVKQSWLCKKKDHYVALKASVTAGSKHVRFEVVSARSAAELGFDPEDFSKGGNATCPFCKTVADADYVQECGKSGGVSSQLLCVVARGKNRSGLHFVAAEQVPQGLLPKDCEILERIKRVRELTGITLPEEAIGTERPSPNARGLTAPTRHGLMRFSDLFNVRQRLSLLVQCAAVREATSIMRSEGYSDDLLRAVATYLGIIVDRMADRGSSLCRWDPSYTKTQSTFGRPALPFVWDYSETNPFGDSSGDISQALDWILAVIREVSRTPDRATIERGSACELSLPDGSMDAVITDPPYYDNVPYADISDYFYVWLKRSVGHLYPEHFSTELSPKKAEITALSSRFAGDMKKASASYEEMMLRSLAEANRVLKPGGELVVVYAHKTTLGWATLVEALRRAKFTVVEAWPLDTEFGGRLIALDSAALASSIFLVARKLGTAGVGNYEEQVRPELQEMVRERVATLWDLGVSGADLVIASVGAGLRSFTRYKKVEYANGEEVPAERFLAEVETAVLETILARLSKEVGGNEGRHGLASVDSPTRFYTLWRYTYKSAELDAGEAIIFANGTHVELDGPRGLSSGARPLVQKKKNKYRLLDYAERGDEAALGMPSEDEQPAPLIDALHRLLWLMERHASGLGEFLREARPNKEQLRLVAQALAGPALKGGELGEVASGTELAALTKLTANWRSVVEDVDLTRVEVGARRAGQSRISFDKGGRGDE